MMMNNPPPGRSHAGRVALVTGSAKGIVQELAVQLAGRGASVALMSRSESSETAERIRSTGGTALVIQGDVSSPADWENAAQAVVDRFGKVDILVNNAGISTHAELDVLDYSH